MSSALTIRRLIMTCGMAALTLLPGTAWGHTKVGWGIGPGEVVEVNGAQRFQGDVTFRSIKPRTLRLRCDVVVWAYSPSWGELFEFVDRMPVRIPPGARNEPSTATRRYSFETTLDDLTGGTGYVHCYRR